MNNLCSLFRIILIIIFLAVAAHGLTHPPMTEEEMLAHSDLIIIATVSDISPKWTDPLHKGILTDYLLHIDEILHLDSSQMKNIVGKDELTLTFAGGVIGDTGFVVPGIPSYRVNETAIFFISAENLSTHAPLVGITAGDYRIGENGMVYKPKACGRPSHNNRLLVTSDAKGNAPDLQQFSQNVRESLAALSAYRDQIRRDWSAKYNPAEVSNKAPSPAPGSQHMLNPGDSLLRLNTAAPASPTEPRMQTVNEQDKFHNKSPGGRVVTEKLYSVPSDNTSSNNLKYAFRDWFLIPPSIPHAFDISPNMYTNPNFGLHFEYTLSGWNKYVDVWRKYIDNDNNFERDHRSDVAFASNYTVTQVYGVILPLWWGVTFCSLDGATAEILASDIIFNNAFSWVTDYQDAYATSGPIPFESIASHEQGHAFGRDEGYAEKWTAVWFSVLQYTVRPMVALFRRPFTDDAESFRSVYPGNIIPIDDLGIFLMSRELDEFNGYYSEASDVESYAERGDSVTINDFMLENVGTTWQVPVVNWWLVSERFTFNDAIYLGQTGHMLLSRGQFASSTVRLPIPCHCPPGNYFVYAQVEDMFGSTDDNTVNQGAWSNIAGNGADESVEISGFDGDNDGHAPKCDNCPFDYNPSQLDTDGDGVGNVCDNCPTASNADQIDSDSDSVGDACDACEGFDDLTDGDVDGIPDGCDNCPALANANQSDIDGDAVGDVCDNCASNANADQNDSDLDTVGDECDNCPNDYNPGQEDDNGDGYGNVCQPDACDIELDAVDGITGASVVRAGRNVSFSIRFRNPFSNNHAYNISGGWRLYSPNGASFSAATIATLENHLDDAYTDLFLYEWDGPGSDSLGVVGIAFPPKSGIPVGFDENVLSITTIIDPASDGKTICLDSSFSRHGAIWEWAPTFGSEYLVRPEWPGPYCFTIIDCALHQELDVCQSCCVTRVGDANGLGGDEPTIGDVSVMIDAKFITGTCDNILECFLEADVNQSGGLDPSCDDITIGDISTLIDYLFITGTSLGLLDCL